MVSKKTKGAEHFNTQIVSAGREPDHYGGIVNPPVYHASTVLSPTLSAWEQKSQDRLQQKPGIYYGRFGTPTTACLTEAMATLDGAAAAFVYPSGVAAIAVALLSVLPSGDHLLMVDCVYGPTRKFAQHFLKRYGITTTFVDSAIGADIGTFFLPNTKAVFLESPGSLTFEIQDIAAVAERAHDHGACVLMDNTWGTALYSQPLQHGVDIVITAATKYIVGHCDVLLGIVSADEKWHDALRQTTYELGQIAGPDDCYLAQRGLRTLAVRLERHQQNALNLVQWLDKQPEVTRIYYPAWEKDPFYERWLQYFTGASGLFSIEFSSFPPSALAAFVDHLQFFGIGASWGGYESLVMPFDLAGVRSFDPSPKGPCLRFHAGLEDVDDLIGDLDQAFHRLRKLK